MADPGADIGGGRTDTTESDVDTGFGGGGEAGGFWGGFGKFLNVAKYFAPTFLGKLAVGGMAKAVREYNSRVNAKIRNGIARSVAEREVTQEMAAERAAISGNVLGPGTPGYQDAFLSDYAGDTTGGDATGTTEKDPKKDPWGNFLDVYFGIKPEGDDPGVPSYLDRVLRDVTFKQDEAKEFLDTITKTSGETLASLQPYSDILKQKVEGTKPISLGFGGKPVTSFITRPDRETGDRYKDLTAAMAEIKNAPASTRYALADLLSPEKGAMTYKADYQDLMKLLLDKYRAEKGYEVDKQRADQSEPGFSWTAFAKDIINIGGGGYDLGTKFGLW